MSELYLYNSLTRQKEVLQPLNKGQVTVYTCGPTVYHFAHIGNLRTFIFEDLLRRTLQFFGYKVIQVMNLTDVDDKTIKGALAQKVSLNEFTATYKKAFFDDLRTLNVDPAEYYPAATDYIPQMIEMIQQLMQKGIAYKGGDRSIYYAIQKFPNYGALSHLHLEDLRVGASNRIEADDYDKEHLADFVLWKAYDASRDGDIFWESPFGPGRPGWHLECSAMAIQLLGHTLDIHIGGIDNMFPHHENEIAQSEACTGKPFVKLWMHAEHLIVDGKKMSKSLGNFFTLRDLIAKGYSGREVRYMLLHTHYKSQLNFTLKELDAVRSSLQRLDDFVYRLHRASTKTSPDMPLPIISQAERQFKESLADDLNISQALAALFDLVREVNILIDQNQLTEGSKRQILDLLHQFNRVLAVLHLSEEQEEAPESIQALFQARLDARNEKNWALADQLRAEILQQGYLIEDAAGGARLKKL